MTQYDQTFPLPQAFPPFSLARILAEVLADQGRTQFRTAETEKYPHVTYFFNGGLRAALSGRGALSDPVAAGGDLRPGAGDERVRHHRRALPDDRGRARTTSCCATTPTPTWWAIPGVLPAVIEAVETVDACLARVLASAERAGVQRPHHRRPWQLRDDDGSSHRRRAYGAHHQPGPVRRRSRRGAVAPGGRRRSATSHRPCWSCSASSRPPR